MRVELLAYTPNPEKLIARCARISRAGDKTETSLDQDRAFIGRLILAGHLSVLEHASATLLVEGISRACLAQLTRHRHLSFTVESGRFVYAVFDSFVLPATAVSKESEVSHERIFRILREVHSLYIDLTRAGVPREDARFFLPQGMGTRLALSGNFRAIREFIQKRSGSDAQWEIRKLASMIATELAKIAPSVFGDLITSFSGQDEHEAGGTGRKESA